MCVCCTWCIMAYCVGRIQQWTEVNCSKCNFSFWDLWMHGYLICLEESLLVLLYCFVCSWGKCCLYWSHMKSSKFNLGGVEYLDVVYTWMHHLKRENACTWDHRINTNIYGQRRVESSYKRKRLGGCSYMFLNSHVDTVQWLWPRNRFTVKNKFLFQCIDVTGI